MHIQANVTNVQIKNICVVGEITKDPQNPL